VAEAPSTFWCATCRADVAVDAGGRGALALRVGRTDAGSYRMTLSYVDPPAGGGKSGDDSDVVEARFVAISPDDCVVRAVDFHSDDPSFAGTMTMTWRSARPMAEPASRSERTTPPTGFRPKIT
jgi:hypothetical protein